MRSRRAAFLALRRVHEQGSWSVQAVQQSLERARLGARDRSFAANLAYETLRWEGTLDWVLAQVVSRPLDEVEPAVLDVLRLGAWQILYGNVPDRAAVDTSVGLARTEIGSRATGFVNGALRALVRRREALSWPPEDDDRGLGLRLAYPTWVVASARERFGERARAVLEAGNQAPGVTLRVVCAPGDDLDARRASLLEELSAAGIAASPGALAPEAVRAPGSDPTTLAAVAEGRAVVQDEASMVVARAVVAAGTPGRVADLCAAPGGKTTHLAQLGAAVYAADLHAGRARMVAEQAGRLALPGPVHVMVADATAPCLPPGSMDAVLVDAPCTGLGVVRRRPELRWRRLAADPARLAGLQLAIMTRAAALVRPGGRLIYSACTFTPEETVGVHEAFTASHGDLFDALDTAALAGVEDPGGGPGLQLDPALHDTDGMYVATYVRTSANR